MTVLESELIEELLSVFVVKYENYCRCQLVGAEQKSDFRERLTCDRVPVRETLLGENGHAIQSPCTERRWEWYTRLGSCTCVRLLCLGSHLGILFSGE